MLESPGTLIPSVLVRIFLVFQFPTDHVTSHTIEVLLWTVAVLIIWLNLGLCPSSVSNLVPNPIDCGVQIFWYQVYCIQEKSLPCIWNSLAGWQLCGLGMGPLYFFRVSRIYESRFCFTVLFTSASINPRHSWHTTPLNSNFEHLMVTCLPSFCNNGKNIHPFNVLQPCYDPPVYQSWYLLRNCLYWGPVQAWHKHLPQCLQFDCWIHTLMLNTNQPNNPFFASCSFTQTSIFVHVSFTVILLFHSWWPNYFYYLSLDIWQASSASLMPLTFWCQHETSLAPLIFSVPEHLWLTFWTYFSCLPGCINFSFKHTISIKRNEQFC